MKYLYLAKKRGAKIAVVNPLREPGLERYWVPSNVESAMFGTKITDEFFPVHTGGDVAFVNGVLKQLLAIGWHRPGVRHRAHRRVRRPARRARERVVRRSRAVSGATAADMARFARMYASAKRAVLVWSMGITQHEHGVDNVQAIVNLGLARGNVGRPGAGLMPIRGHSGVQGGAEMGCYATAFPGGVAIDDESAAALERAVGVRRCPPNPVSPRPRWSTAARARRARRALVERRQLPRRAARARRHARRARRARRCACTRTSCVTHQMLVDPGETVVLLPAATRYEQEGGGTSTTTERRVAFSPEIAGPARRRGAQRSGRSSPTSRAASGPTSPTSSAARPPTRSAPRSRGVVPAYAGIERSARDRRRDPGRRARACARAAVSRRPTAGRTSRVVAPHASATFPRAASCSRPGGASSSTRWCGPSAIRSPARHATRCSLSDADAGALGVADGDAVLVRSDARRDAGAGAPRADPARQRAGVLPRGQRAAVAGRAASRSRGVPDYNAVVEVVPVR